MLRKIRIAVEIVFFVLISLLFLDFTGVIQTYFSWMDDIQFIPAILALNVVYIVILLVLALVFGRIYCSVICPLGVFQDIISFLRTKKKRNHFKYKKPHTTLRIIMLVAFVALLLVGFTSIAGLIAPYSAYGRIATNIFAPIYNLGNEALVYLAERLNSYTVYSSHFVWLKSLLSFVVALITLIVIVVLAWKDGRIYCNTICPVGTVLGFISKFSLFKIAIDTNKCNGCKVCSKNCKSSCINPDIHQIDYSRCVACMDCIGNCRQHAISYTFLPKKNAKVEHEVDKLKADLKDDAESSRRTFLTLAGAVAVATTVHAQKKRVDGGLATLKKKEVPERKTMIVPPGAFSIDHFAQHCTACQQCIAECPNHVLQPSTRLSNLMQPEMTFEKGACRPECNMCSQICPTGAIKPITRAEKSSIQIGHAVWISKNCLVNTDSITCGNCARHCPNGAIRMMAKDANDEYSAQIPIVDLSRCIGCGICESVCPARPFTAIYVEGHLVHKHI
jgi:ferredoxin